MKKGLTRNIYKIYFFLFFILLFLFLLNNSLEYLDLDFGWHLRVGKEILENHEVPHLENYLYPLSGKRWVDHEWLSNLGIYFIYKHFGYFILNIIFTFFPLLSILILLLISKNFFLKKNQSLIISPFLLTLGIMSMAPHLGIRVQEITLLFLSILILIILDYNQQKNRKKLFILIPLFLLWANLHGGFLIGFAILGYYIFYKIILFILKKEKNIKEIFFLILIFTLSLLSTFLTPYGIELYSFFLTYSDTYYMTHISEWLPSFSYPFIYPQLFYNALYTTILILIFKERKKNKNYNYWYLSLSIVFFILAFKSRRHFPLFFIISFPLILDFITQDFIINEKWKKFFQKNILINTFLISTISLVILYFIFSIRIINNPFNDYEFCQSAPCTAIQFMKDNEELKDLNLFNNYNWGGYLDWTWPEKKIFTDGRLPIVELNGHSFLEEYNSFFIEEKGGEKLKNYKIKMTLLSKTKTMHFNWFEKIFLGLKEDDFDQTNYLDEFLQKSSKWNLIYEDQISKIYIQNNQNTKQ